MSAVCLIIAASRSGKNGESGNEIAVKFCWFVGNFHRFSKKKNVEMKFLKKFFEVFVVNQQSSYVKARPTH